MSITAVERERDGLMAAMWECYVLTGADTDGDDAWHCTPEEAAMVLTESVRDMRNDYDEAIA